MVWVLRDHLIPRPSQAEQSRFPTLLWKGLSRTELQTSPSQSAASKQLHSHRRAPGASDKRDQNFTLKSYGHAPKPLNAADQNAAFPGGKTPELWICWLLGLGRAGQAGLTGWLMWKRVGILLMMAESRSWGRLVAPITITCVTPTDTSESSAGKHPQPGNGSTSHGISPTLSSALTIKEVTSNFPGSDLTRVAGGSHKYHLGGDFHTSPT